jgi:hypothetical protein
MIGPPWSTWVLNLINLGIVAGYWTAARNLIRRHGAAKNASPRERLSGISFFFACGTTHALLSYHFYSGEQILHPDGSVHWPMFAHMPPQLISIWVYLLSAQHPGRRPVGGRWLRLRHWWWQMGQPPDLGSGPQLPLEGAGAFTER